jgi:hypothetical protein
LLEADDNLQNHYNSRKWVLIISCDYNSFINIESKKVTVKMPIIESLRFVLHRLQVQIQLKVKTLTSEHLLLQI